MSVFVNDVGVRLIPCAARSCAAARNAGTAASSGRVLCFVDADTIVPENAAGRILTKTGFGTLTLSGTNYYSGQLQVNAGVVNLASNNAVGVMAGTSSTRASTRC